MNKYKKELIKNTSKLDAVTNGYGEITKLASLIIEDNDKEATALLLKKISEVVDNKSYKIEIKQLAQLVNSNLIEYYGYTTLQSLFKKDTEIIEDSRSLEELIRELNNLVGLKTVKSKVYGLIAYQKVQKLRKESGLYSTKNTLHMSFTGNPGTGKTTVARIVGHIYKQIGLLSKGHFLEVSRTDLIAGYQGQTALKVKAVIEKAKGGVLFIDEAYSITENEHSDSYGRECLTEITKALEDYRDDLVVIVAGYRKPMEIFFESNPGLKSRFNTFIDFPDYSIEELNKILTSICNSNDYVLSKNIYPIIYNLLEDTIVKIDENFANGRFIRNLYDDLVMNHALRVSKIEKPTKDDLHIITEEDFI